MRLSWWSDLQLIVHGGEVSSLGLTVEVGEAARLAAKVLVGALPCLETSVHLRH